MTDYDSMPDDEYMAMFDDPPVPAGNERLAGRELPAPSDPVAVARKVAGLHPEPLRYWRGDFYKHLGTHWNGIDASAVRHWLTLITEAAFYMVPGKNGQQEKRKWAPTTQKINGLLDMLGTAVVYRDANQQDERAMAFTNGVLINGRLVEHSEDRFNLTSLPFAYDPTAKCPEWTKFLESTLPADWDSQDCLAEWFGYVLSGRTDLQKMAVLVGPRRCGKGTIARVLEAMVGATGWAAPTLARLGGNFGMESLIGKSLAVMGDVRWTSKHVIDAVPILLGMVGEDGFSVPRKNREDWIGKLGTRVMLMSNDAPVFTDASGALAGRMVYVAFSQSFYGREDFELENRLMKELSGILNWALEGLKRLESTGRFTQSYESNTMRAEVERDSSPVTGFVDDRCVLDPKSSLTLDALLSNYLDWLSSERIPLSPSKSRLSRDLMSAYGDQGLRITRKPNSAGGKHQVVFGLRVLPGASIEI